MLRNVVRGFVESLRERPNGSLTVLIKLIDEAYPHGLSQDPQPLGNRFGNRRSDRAYERCASRKRILATTLAQRLHLTRPRLGAPSVAGMCGSLSRQDRGRLQLGPTG